MRIYKDFITAINEIERDVAEMGIDIQPESMQDKVLNGDENYATKELQNYIYTVVNASNSINDLEVSRPWVDLEFVERINCKGANPGEAYKAREEVWNEFLHGGKFAYSYGERIGFNLLRIVNEIRLRPNSRQLYLSIWDREKDIRGMGGSFRIPCSLGYLFQVRNGQLDITYFMRSCDLKTHMQNDIYLAVKLMMWVAEITYYKPGNFTHYIGSLHVYKKDTEGVF
jgi:thymidylate synthase